MNLPFYETGTIEKKPMGEKDIRITMELLREIRPQQVYCAGDFADPHGTHIVCFQVVIEALRRIKAAGDPWINDCWLWLYKGAWEEWEPHEIEMAVPLSPETIEQKKQAIFRHQSQKDKAMFPGGTDRREFWQRAEDRNLGTARIYDALGLPEYYALEAFVKWKDQ